MSTSTNLFSALLHAEGLPPQGLPVIARFAGEYLIVDGAERAQVPVSRLTIRAGGFNQDCLFLDWPQNGRTHSLQPADSAARAQLLLLAPASMRVALQSAMRVTQKPMRAWRWLAVVAATLLLAIVLAVSQQASLVDWIARQISPAMEMQLGDATLDEIRRSSTLIEQGPAIDSLKPLGDRLTAGSKYHYRWLIKVDPSVNAFALPGGTVVIHTGLIAAAQSPDELAGVLAHEVQHVEQRHTLKGMIHSVGWAGALSLLFGDVSSMAAALVQQAGQLGYSRDLEREADRLGVRALDAAGIDPSGMPAFLRRTMLDETEAPLALLSTHPATRERLAAIEADIAALPRRDYPPLVIDWAALQAVAGAHGTSAASPVQTLPAR